METRLAIPTLTARGRRNINKFVDIKVRKIRNEDGMAYGIADYEGATYRVRRNTRLGTAWFIYERAS